jgi:predicted membrane protein
MLLWRVRPLPIKIKGGKMRFNPFAIIGILVLLFFTFFTKKAYAYLDPGTGSYIFQMIIAFVIGGLFAIKLFWAKIALFFKNLFSKNQKNDRS